MPAVRRSEFYTGEGLGMTPKTQREQTKLIVEELLSLQQENPPKGTQRWYNWIPGWVPIVVTILGSAFYLGERVQAVQDLLDKDGDRLTAIEVWVRNHSRVDAPPLSVVAPAQDAQIPPIRSSPQ
jgi:hypothetical protein